MLLIALLLAGMGLTTLLAPRVCRWRSGGGPGGAHDLPSGQRPAIRRRHRRRPVGSAGRRRRLELRPPASIPTAGGWRLVWHFLCASPPYPVQRALLGAAPGGRHRLRAPMAALVEVGAMGGTLYDPHRRPQVPLSGVADPGPLGLPSAWQPEPSYRKAGFCCLAPPGGTRQDATEKKTLAHINTGATFYDFAHWFCSLP